MTRNAAAARKLFDDFSTLWVSNMDREFYTLLPEAYNLPVLQNQSRHNCFTITQLSWCPECQMCLIIAVQEYEINPYIAREDV